MVLVRVCAGGAVFAVLALSEGRGDRVFEGWLSEPAAAGPEGPPFPELRPATQGDPRGCGSSSHVAGGSEEFAYGIHRDGVQGGGGVGRGRERPHPSARPQFVPRGRGTFQRTLGGACVAPLASAGFRPQGRGPHGAGE